MPHLSWKAGPAQDRCVLSAAVALAASLIAALPSPVRAQSVSGTYTFVNNTYYYAFRVINDTPTELAIIAARLPDTSFVVNDPMAPQGFLLSYTEADGDSNGIPDGYLNFGTDPSSNASFGPFTVSAPFTFNSPTFLGGMVYEGNFADTNFTPFSGNVSLTAAPEPAAIVLVLSGLAMAGIVHRRRRA